MNTPITLPVAPGILSEDVTGTKAQALAGATFLTADSDDEPVQGEIVTKSDSGNTTLKVGTVSKSYAAGYYPNAHGAAITLEEKTATPGTAAQTISPSSNKVLSKVTVAAIPNQKSDSGNVTLDASTLTKSYAAGYYAAAHGAKITTQEKTAAPGLTATDITPDSGKVLSKVTIPSTKVFDFIKANYSDASACPATVQKKVHIHGTASGAYQMIYCIHLTKASGALTVVPQGASMRNLNTLICGGVLITAANAFYWGYDNLYFQAEQKEDYGDGYIEFNEDVVDIPYGVAAPGLWTIWGYKP